MNYNLLDKWINILKKYDERGFKSKFMELCKLKIKIKYVQIARHFHK